MESDTNKTNKSAKWTSKFNENPPIKFIPKHERSTKRNSEKPAKTEVVKPKDDPVLENPISQGKSITIKRKRTDDPFDFFVLESENTTPNATNEVPRPLKRTAINIGEDQLENEEKTKRSSFDSSKKIYKLAYSISSDPNIGVTKTTSSTNSRRVFHLSMKRKKEGKTTITQPSLLNDNLTNSNFLFDESKERKKSKFSKSSKAARNSVVLSKREFSSSSSKSKSKSEDYVTDVYTFSSNVDENEILQLLNSKEGEKENKTNKTEYLHLESFDENLLVDEDDINLVIQYDEDGNYITGILEHEYLDDSEDSNAEDYFTNDYPDEESNSDRDSISNGSVSDDFSDEEMNKMTKKMSRIDFNSDEEEDEEHPLYEKLSYWENSKQGYDDVVNEVELSD